MDSQSRRLVVRSFALAVTLPLCAQSSPDPAQHAQAIRHDATTLILPAGTHPLRDVVNAAAAFLERNILLDEQELKMAPGDVTLQTTMELDRTAAEDVVSDLLYSHGLLLVARDREKGLYEAIHLQGRRGREALGQTQQRTPDEILARPTLKQPVSTVVQLQQMNATMATNALRPFFAAQGGPNTGLCVGAADNDKVILSGIQADVARAIEVIRQADTPAPAPATAPGEPARIEALERTIAELQQRVTELERRLKADR